MRKATTAILLALLLQGCVTATKDEVATANFGPLPADYQERVKTFMTTEVIRLRPETATFDFHGPPRKGIYQAGLVGVKKRYGWIVSVKVRVKNHLGLHVSQECFVFIGGDGKLEDCTEYFGQLARYVD